MHRFTSRLQHRHIAESFGSQNMQSQSRKQFNKTFFSQPKQSNGNQTQAGPPIISTDKMSRRTTDSVGLTFFHTWYLPNMLLIQSRCRRRSPQEFENSILPALHLKSAHAEFLEFRTSLHGTIKKISKIKRLP